MRVRLNLATMPLLTHRPFLAAAGLIGFFGSLAFVWLGWHVLAARKAEAATRSRAAQIQSDFATLRQKGKELDQYFKQPEIARLSDRAAFINSMIDERSFNWTQMFMDLERVLPNGVRLMSVQPQLVKGNMEVKLAVGTASDEAKIKFLRALESSKTFTNVVLLSEHAPQQATPGAEMVVELRVIYSRV